MIVKHNKDVFLNHVVVERMMMVGKDMRGEVIQRHDDGERILAHHIIVTEFVGKIN